MPKKQAPRRGELEKLSERLSELAYLGSAIGVLHWDREVCMPKKGAGARAKTLALLAGMAHQRLLEIDRDGLLSGLKKKLEGEKLTGGNAAIVRETWRSFERARKLPETFVKEMAEITSNAQTVWEEAREKSDFALFAPYLETIIEKKRKEAEFVGYEESPYDALLDEYEPGMTSNEVERIFDDLKRFLVPFLARIRTVSNSVRPLVIAASAHFPIEQQVAFNKRVAKAVGYDLEAGRIDVSAHPFTLSFHPHDVRFTTRYNPKNPLESLFPVLHEGGHALYDQGLPHEQFGTPLCDFVSLGIHESQSRLWENLVGRSLPFWKHWYPKLSKAFPEYAKQRPLSEFYRSLNIVKSSLIRVNADEVTYNLHIIIRFEIEKALIEGSIEVKDLAHLWNTRYKEYLGIEPKNDAEGVLQDVHWSSGYIGYFPTYALGNLYSAQLWNTAKVQIPNLETRIAGGDLLTLREWLKNNVHRHGKLFSADDLIMQITGERLNPDHFSRYLTEKYGAIYHP